MEISNNKKKVLNTTMNILNYFKKVKSFSRDSLTFLLRVLFSKWIITFYWLFNYVWIFYPLSSRNSKNKHIKRKPIKSCVKCREVFDFITLCKIRQNTDFLWVAFSRIAQNLRFHSCTGKHGSEKTRILVYCALFNVRRKSFCIQKSWGLLNPTILILYILESYLVKLF